ncbi:MAG: hypothetical protein ACOYU3_10470 [Bacillota bacterium]
MKNSDKAISLVVTGALAPAALMLLFWWGSIPFIGDDGRLALLALAGFVTGIVLDCTLLRKFIFRLFELPLPVLIAVQIFYSVMVYGFFMGFPVQQPGRHCRMRCCRQKLHTS